jgi:hypothetical protein
MSEPFGAGESQSYSLKPGDKVEFHNQQPSPVRIRVTTQCGTVTEAELHPGAVFRLTAGNATVNAEILPPEEPYTGIQAVE